MIIELSGSSGDFLGHRLVVKGNGRTERGGRGKGVQSSSTEYKGGGGLKPMTKYKLQRRSSVPVREEQEYCTVPRK